MSAPKWLETAIFYEIYPQSFADSDGDGVGDIPGIIAKLDYVKGLGCDAIWLNPCYLSPFDDAGYDVEDFCRVAPRYGTNEDLFRLFREAHARGMRVILDLVPGHTSYRHPWFGESKKPGRNEMTDRYVWTDSVWESPEGMQCLRGISRRDGSVAVNFFSTQPALNYGFHAPDPKKPWQQAMDAPGPMATRAALKDIMRFWLGAGCDGFRVDMAGSLVKNDVEGKGTISLWQDFRAFLEEEFPEAVMVSEWGEPDKSLASGFHMDFLLHFGPSHYNDLFRAPEPWFSRRGKGDLIAFWKAYRESRRKAGTEGLICIPSGNHDMDRMARHLDPAEMKLAFAFLLTMPGVPFIYYGDEIGMRHVEGLESVEGGYGRTGARSPMQWDNALPNAGFSAAAPSSLYIAQDPDPARPDVKTQEAHQDSLFSEVKRLVALRRATPGLANHAGFELLSKGNYPLVYSRGEGSGRLLVVINPSHKYADFDSHGFAGKIIHRIGGSVKLDGEESRIDAETAVVICAGT